VGNAVGPVTLIAGGIYLGYLTLTGRAANFVAFVKSGGTSVSSSSSSSGGSGSSSTPDPNLDTTPGSSATGSTAAEKGSIFGVLPAGAAGTAAGMSKAQAAAAAVQAQALLDIYNAYGAPASSN
jgi:hypothetical protein